MNNTIKISLGLALALVGFQAQAFFIISGDITKAECMLDVNCYYGPANSPANPSVGEIEALIAAQGGGTVSLFEVYKENVGDGFDSGSFADSYETTFSNTATDPEDATITWNGPDVLSCPECFLLVKDGNQDPSWYVFDIGSWDGMETIYIVDFWLGNGSISHITIYDDGTNVPEPSIVALLSLGLIGMGLVRRKA